MSLALRRILRLCEGRARRYGQCGWTCQQQSHNDRYANHDLGGVGTEVKWQSESRKNVTGSSKVTGSQELADGSQCMTVTDVVIIDGEETTVPKKMCRGKGDSGYRKA